MRADLHIHTYHSDGSFPTETLIDLAEKNRLDYLAITDHDCFASFETATRLIGERGLGLKLIPAAEFTAMLNGEEIHIHGYFKEAPSPRLLQYAQMVQAERRARIERALEILGTIGVKATMDEIPAHPDCLSLTQLHLAFLLISKNYARSMGEARRVYLNERVLPKFTMRAEDVIQTISSEGGLAVWAHPDEENFDNRLKTLMGFGLAGLEVFNLRRQEKASKQFLKASKKNGLVASLGSDWHGHSHTYHYDHQLDGTKILPEFLGKLYH
ncbi:MAG: PHP domain-containing protein [Acidobacteriia bacterium]|nr:PHP domain-containing protein [Terriglobia bacterium]